jgi:indolepyruvate decarboxylase
MNLSQCLLTALRAHGAREIFGIPGDFALGFFRAIEESRILPLYTLSHEPGAAFAADAAARIGCRLGVVAATYGAGALNMVNAVAGAYAEKSPLVVISGAPGAGERGAGLLLHHQVKTFDSQQAIFREITCAHTVLDDAERAPGEIARVLRRCLDDFRPVYIELPRDMVGAPCAAVQPLSPLQPDPAALAAAADELLAALRAAKRPAIVLGVEVRRYGIEGQVAELLRRLAIPAFTSLMGRGLLAGEGELVTGTYLGMAGDAEIAERVESSDALLLLGVIMSDTNFGVSRRHIDLRRTILAADRALRLAYHVYPDVPLNALIDTLLDRLPASGAVTARMAPSFPHGLTADESAIRPLDIARAVNDLAAEHGAMPIVSDVGDCLFTSFDMANSAQLAPGYYAGMGFGAPAGLGLQIASGQRPIVLVGDGAFEMTGWELGNAARYGLDPIVLLFNNRRWEMLHVFEPASGFLDRGDWQFAAMAPGMGGDGVRVRTRRELGAALHAAHARRGRFQLIEVMLEPGAISPTLERFVAAVKRPPAPMAAPS